MNTNEATTIRLTSNAAVYTPGVLRWLRAVGDVARQAELVRSMFPTLVETAVQKVVAGDYTIEGEDVLVTI